MDLDDALGRIKHYNGLPARNVGDIANVLLDRPALSKHVQK